MLFFLQFRIEPDWDYPVVNGGYVNTTYIIKDVFYDVHEKLTFDPYSKDDNWDTINSEGIEVQSNAQNLRFMFIGQGFNLNDNRFKPFHVEDGDIGDNSIGKSNDTSRLLEGTGALSIALLPNFSKLENTNFSYFWMKKESETDVREFLTEIAKLKDKNYEYFYDIIVMSSARGNFKMNGQQLFPFYRYDLWDFMVDKIIEDQSNRTDTSSPIIIFRAGDDGVLPLDAQYNTLNYLPQTFLIGSSAATGGSAFYSQWSSGLLAVIPSGGIDTLTFGLSRFFPSILVADSVTGEDRPGYGSNMGTGIFASVIAMMKTKFNRTKIDYRTVLYMVALTSTIIDEEHPMWIKNNASVMFNPAFGYGRIELSKLLDENLFNEINNLKGDLVKRTVYTNYKKLDTYLQFATEKDNIFEFVFPNGTNMSRVETVQFSFYLQNLYYSDIHVRIESPSGTVAIIRQGGKGEQGNQKNKFLPKMEFVILSREFFGERPNGTWKVYIKHWNYIPVDRIWGLRLNFTGSTDSEKISKHVHQGHLEKKPYVHNNTVGAVKFTEEAPRQCMKLQNVTFNLKDLGLLYPDNISSQSTVYLSYYLRSVINNNRIFDLRPKRINYSRNDDQNQMINYSFVAPCILKNNSQIVMGVRNILSNRSIETQPFNLINNHKIGLIDQKGFEIYTDNVSEFYYSFHEDYFPEHGKPQFIQMTAYDLEEWEPVYAWTHLNNGSFFVNFSNLNRTVKKGILSLSMMTTTNNCSSIIYPFRRYRVSDYPKNPPKKPFKIRIKYQNDDYCNYMDSNIFKEYHGEAIVYNSAQDYRSYIGDGLRTFAISVPIVIHAAAIAIVIFVANFFKKTNNDASSNSK